MKPRLPQGCYRPMGQPRHRMRGMSLLATSLIVLAVIALLLLLYAGSARMRKPGQSHAGTQGPSTSTEMVRMRIAGQMFCIPRNYIWSLDKNPDGVIDRDGINLHFKYPEMTGMTAQTRKLFWSTPGSRPVVHAVLSEDLRGSHRDFVQRQRDWLLTQTPVATTENLKIFASPSWAVTDSKRNELILVNQNDASELLSCKKSEPGRFPNCYIMKPYPEKLYYEVTFFRDYLPQAIDIRERTEHLIQSFQTNCR